MAALCPVDCAVVIWWVLICRADTKITMAKRKNIERQDQVVRDWSTLFLVVAWDPSFVPLSKSGAEGTRLRVSPTVRLAVLT